MCRVALTDTNIANGSCHENAGLGASVGVLLVALAMGSAWSDEAVQPGPVLLTAGNSSAFLRDDGTFTVRNVPAFSVWGRRPEGGLFPGPERSYRIRARVGEEEVAASTLFSIPFFIGSPRQTIPAPPLQADLANIPEITSIRLLLEPAVVLASSTVRLQVLGTSVSGSETELPLSEPVSLWSSPVLLPVDAQRSMQVPGPRQSPVVKTWIVASYLGLSAQAQLTILSPQNQDHDADGDGISDAWERLYGFNPADPADGLLDPDGDSLTNLEESVLNTNPLHADSDEDGLRDDLDPEPLTAERLPPTIVFLSPAANQTVDPRDPDFQVAGQVTDDVQLRNANVIIGSTSYAIAASGAFTFTQLLSALSPAPAGETLVTMSATDRAGNRTVVSRTIIVAPSPPAVKIISPDISEALAPGSPYEVQIIATDDRAVTGVDLLVNGLIVAHLTSSPYRATITVPADATALTLTARAVDTFGNTAEDARTYTLTTQDAAGPTIQVQPGDGFVAATGAIVTVDITATDPSGVGSLDLTVDAGTVERPDAGVARWLWTMPATIGTIRGHVSATDTRGNVSEKTVNWNVTLPGDAISFIKPSADTTWIAGCSETVQVAIPQSLASGLESRLLLNGVSWYSYLSTEALPDGRAILQAHFQVPVSVTAMNLVLDVTAPGLGLRRIRSTVPVEPWPGVVVSGDVYRGWDVAADAPGLVWLDAQAPAVIAADNSYTLYLGQPPRTSSYYGELCAAILDARSPSAGMSALVIDSGAARTGHFPDQHIYLWSRPGAQLSGGVSIPDTGWPLPFDPNNWWGDGSTQVRVDQSGTLFYGPEAGAANVQVGGSTLSAAAASMSVLPEELSVIVHQGSWSRVEWIGDADQGLATWISLNPFSFDQAVQVWLRRGHEPAVVNRTGTDPYAANGPQVHASKRSYSGGIWRGIALDAQSQQAIPHNTAVDRYDATGDGQPDFIARWWSEDVIFQDDITPGGGYTGDTELPYQGLNSYSAGMASAFDGWTNGSLEYLQRSALVTQVVSDGAPVPGAVIQYAGSEVRADSQGFAVLHSANVRSTPSVSRLYVNADATGTGDGLSWTNACTSLDAAITAATGMGEVEVWVAQGTYRPSIEMLPGDSRSASFHFTSTAWWYGGFTGAETDRRHADPARHPTVLSGDLGTISDSSDNARAVVTADHYLYLDGFVIEGGAGGTGAGLHLRGGGAVSRCVIRDNHSGDEDGGGIACDSMRSLFLDRCLVIGNSARRGGGMALQDTYLFAGNTAFFANTAMESGSAIELVGVNQALTGFLRGTLRSCTLIDGDVVNAGIPLIGNRGLDVRIVVEASVILPSSGAPLEDTMPSHASCAWCVAPLALPGGATNMVATPVFRDPSIPAGVDGWWGTADDGLGLAEGSPGIDAITVLQVGEVTDLTGSSRSAGAAPDAGAYERDGVAGVLALEDFVQYFYEQGRLEVAPMTITNPDDPGNPVEVPVVGSFPNQINVLPPVDLPIPVGIGSLNVLLPGRAVADTTGGE